jgi:plasmid stabilization system protein ParE
VSVRVIFRPAAEQDVDIVFAWYERQRIGLGDQFLRSLSVTVEFIRANPMMYPVVSGSFRRAALKRFPYLLFYTVEPSRVVVIGCLHARRDPET